MNPGTEFKNWPWNKGRGAESFLDRRGKFNHNYMERFWPKHAHIIEEPTANAADFRSRFRDKFQVGQVSAMRGIMYEYGDLKDVVELMLDDPLTRQAYFPIWFPEDTGGGDKRAPCTIGYHFMMRNNRLSVNYHIRSCDFVKHFRNDIYLTVRLLLWVLQQLQSRDPRWKDVVPGDFMMQIGSLHSFKPDWELI
jgi:thymidylate synthase